MDATASIPAALLAPSASRAPARAGWSTALGDRPSQVPVRFRDITPVGDWSLVRALDGPQVLAANTHVLAAHVHRKALCGSVVATNDLPAFSLRSARPARPLIMTSSPSRPCGNVEDCTIAHCAFACASMRVVASSVSGRQSVIAERSLMRSCTSISRDTCAICARPPMSVSMIVRASSCSRVGMRASNRCGIAPIRDRANDSAHLARARSAQNRKA